MNSNLPIFQQIMEIIENDIISGVYQTDDLIISTTQIAKLYAVNPTTAVKAVGKLTEAGILYKMRGIGMCVANGARTQIVERRRDVFVNETVGALLEEARTLGFTRDELMQMIQKKKGMDVYD